MPRIESTTTVELPVDLALRLSQTYVEAGRGPEIVAAVSAAS